jgi:hypothetical protein
MKDLSTSQLISSILELMQEKYHLPNQWQAIQALSHQLMFPTRTIQSWLAGEHHPQPRNRLALEYLLTTLKQK